MRRNYYQGVQFCIKPNLKPGAQTVLNSNEIMFEPYGDIVDEAYSHYNAYMLENQDPSCQIEDDETAETGYSNDQDDENAGSKKSLQFYILCQGSLQMTKF